MATPVDFARALLNRLDLPQTDNRIVGLVAFAGLEGGHWHNGARYNPFNTTLSMPGSVSMNGAGVKAYVNWEQGIDATARTMLQSNMSAMMNALRANVDPQSFLASITKTAWCPQSAPSCAAYENANAVAVFNARKNDQDASDVGDEVDWMTVAAAGGIFVTAGAALWWVKSRFF